MLPLLIGPYDLGIQRNMKPFMIPDKAFTELFNCFVWRGRVERKPGYELLGRLRRLFNLFNLGAIGVPLSLDLKLSLSITEPTATIAPGFVITFAAPISQVLTDTGTGTLTIDVAGTISSATVNYLTGIVTINGGVAVANATFTGGYYPGLPAMGIRVREVASTINSEIAIVFDTTYAYRHIGTGFEELPSTIPVTWHGTDSQQFWTTNFERDELDQNLFWATNNVTGLHSYLATAISLSAWVGGVATARIDAAGHNFSVGENVSLVNFPATGAGSVPGGTAFGTITAINAGVWFDISVSTPQNPYFVDGAVTGIASGDPLITQNNANQDGIRLYNGSTWRNFNPAVDGASVLVGALLLVPFHNRMVALNTWEGSNTVAPVNFPNRARWSQNGTSWAGGIGWRSDIAGQGGFDDAATDEQIISCGLYKDVLIVYFERSTWQLVYTQNEIAPFTWLRINSELGGESTFSTTIFDKGTLAIANVGIHASNGVEVQRIDEQIPDEIFQIHNGTDGPQRVSGIRDFYQEIVYWAYPQATANTADLTKINYPDRMLIYNYRNNTFATFDDNATCLGYFQRQNDVPWSSLNTFPWSAWNMPWNSPVLQNAFPSVAFGNQQGYISMYVPDISFGDATLAITALSGTTVTSPQHNIFTGDYVCISDCTGSVNLNDNTYKVTVTGADTFTISEAAVGTYTGGGQITRCSNVAIKTKQFTPFWEKGKDYTMKYVDMLFDKTSDGEIHVDIYVDFNDTISMTDDNGGSRLGTANVATHPEGETLPYYSFQQEQAQIWKRFYADAYGETFQLKLSYDDTQMQDPNISESDLALHAMLFYFEEAGEFI